MNGNSGYNGSSAYGLTGKSGAEGTIPSGAGSIRSMSPALTRLH